MLASIAGLSVTVALTVALPEATASTTPVVSTVTFPVVSELKVNSVGDTKKAAVPSFGIANTFKVFEAFEAKVISPPSIANAITLSYHFLSNNISVILAYTGLSAVHPPLLVGV